MNEKSNLFDVNKNDLIKINKMQNLARTVAHEIKNPLAVTLAHLEIIKQNDVNGDNEKNIEIMIKNLNDINNLMIEFVKATSTNLVENEKTINNLNMFEEEAITFNVLELINSCLNKYSMIYFEKIKFEVITDNEKSLYIFAKKDLLKIAIDNILKNAVESVLEENERCENKGSVEERKSGLIQIIITKKTQSIVIEFKDNGIGLSLKFSEIIKKEAYTTKTFGSGIGLKICNDAINANNGKFILHNNNNKGCTAKLELFC